MANRTDSSASARRRLGAYYTPEPISRWMLRSCLEGPLAADRDDLRSPPRILDPACGDGAFLVGALQELHRAFNAATDNSETALRFAGTDAPRCATAAGIVARQLFGVDLDPVAIRKLRRRIAYELAGESALASELRQVLRANFRIGDALCGNDFRLNDERRCHRESQNSGRRLDWRRAFAEVADAGGFDLVIGNPPYRREKGAQQLFQQLAQTELGRRWRQPRMDLWHYFLHRGLDLLRPGGVLCYIVNSYWMSAHSAQPMIARLRDETTVREIVLLGNARIFEGVTGRHMILQVQKSKHDAPCRVIDLTRAAKRVDVLQQLSHLADAGPSERTRRALCVSQQSLFVRGRFAPLPERPLARKNGHALGELFDVRQGIAENPPFVTAAIRDQLGPELTVGAGVFVLTREEIHNLKLSRVERKLLRPYYAARTIGRDSLPRAPAHWLLYMTRRTAPDLSRFPNLARHLGRFRPVLERRREAQRGSIAWWHLHWPREERLFVEPRILGLQMCATPSFVYVERPAFVGFAVNVIRPRAQSPARISLAAAAAVLNSASAAEWFGMNAKHRGAALDISGALLREFPFQALDRPREARLTARCLTGQTSDAESR